ncbi:MAG: 3-isopropylmalate dehydratase small subunit [bacterium]|nr:3-isopropylmalate dehydratase small subunit [bacterium]
MKAFQSITAQVIPLDRKDVDTDMVIPANFLTSTSQGGYGENLFRRLRDGEPDFPLNQKKFQAGKILVARNNFGCGSSREHAVWALLEYGIEVVIAPSFADIFHNNSGKNGLITAVLSEEIIDRIIRESQRQDQYQISVDLAKQTVTLPDGSTHEFPYDAFRKDCILKGHEDFDYLMDHMAEIEGWQDKRDQELFYSTLQPNNS